MSLQLAAIMSVMLRGVMSLYLAFLLVSLFLSFSESLLSLILVSLVVDYTPRSDIFVENFLRSSAACISSSRTTASIRNDGRSTESSTSQLRIFLDL